MHQLKLLSLWVAFNWILR